MQMGQKLADKSDRPMKTMLRRFCIVVVFAIAFAYIEAAVVVYLREIFHLKGFTFPLTEFGITAKWGRLLLTEVGREAATLVLIFSAAWLFGKNRRQRFAYFMTIFAVWDIFYYVWLKVLLDWPTSVMDWDILFLIPTAWAGPVVAPVAVSVTLLLFAAIILYRDACARPIKVGLIDWVGLVLAGLIVCVSFIIAGRHITEADYQAYFYWPLFALGHISAIALFVKCLLKSR